MLPLVSSAAGVWSKRLGNLAMVSSSSLGGSPKSVVGTYSLASIPVAWDNSPSIRERIRDHQNLCLAFNHEKSKGESTYVDATTDSLKLNAAVLEPLAELMCQNDQLLPSIDNLISGVDEFFQLAKLSRSSDQCYQEAWALRRMIGKLKKFTYRSHPPQDCPLIKL